MGKIDRNSFEAARSLTGGLKAKSRQRRETLGRMAASSSPARAPRNDLLPPLDLAYVPLEDLRMPTREVRKLDPAHVREVANSISALGFCTPILVGKDNLVLDGAVRVQAARLLGLGRAPCVRIENLSETDQRVLRLAVNRLGEKGEWNLDELKIEFAVIWASTPFSASEGPSGDIRTEPPPALSSPNSTIAAPRAALCSMARLTAAFRRRKCVRLLLHRSGLSIRNASPIRIPSHMSCGRSRARRFTPPALNQRA